MTEGKPDADRDRELLIETCGFDIQAQVEALLRCSNKLLRGAASLRETRNQDTRKQLWGVIADAIAEMTKECDVLRGTLGEARGTVPGPQRASRKPQTARRPVV